ncbi:hypothetical protein F4680DRAFT_74074 [Xylaria scruposa]|nr:hypothetical protein F4680DRAFT_74074 [Xylaria scruposa]
MPPSNNPWFLVQYPILAGTAAQAEAGAAAEEETETSRRRLTIFYYVPTRTLRYRINHATVVALRTVYSMSPYSHYCIVPTDIYDAHFDLHWFFFSSRRSPIARPGPGPKSSQSQSQSQLLASIGEPPRLHRVCLQRLRHAPLATPTPALRPLQSTTIHHNPLPPARYLDSRPGYTGIYSALIRIHTPRPTSQPDASSLLPHPTSHNPISIQP